MNWKPKLVARAMPVVVSPAGAAWLALAVYVLTLCRGGYPGGAAMNVALVAGLVPEQMPAHPIWLLVCRGVAHLPLGTLALRLNALSALCGAAASLLLGNLVARLLYAMASEDAGGAVTVMRPAEETEAGHTKRGRPARTGAENDAGVSSAAVSAHNRRAAVAAKIGGAVATLALAFSAACWSASTRLHYESFDALLLLTAGHLLLAYDRFGRRSQALLLAGLCGAGCVESVVFIVSAPVFFAFALRTVLRTETPRAYASSRVLFALLLATLAGAFANLLLLRRLDAAGASGAPSLLAVFVAMVRYHRAMLQTALPRVGWLWAVMLAYVPVGLAGLGGWRAFQERATALPAVHVLFTFANVLCLANASFSPWGHAREGGYLPIMAYIAAAATAGYLFAYWRMLAAPPDQAGTKRLQQQSSAANFWLGSILVWVPVVTVCLAPMANLSEASGRQGDFADRVARGVLARLGDRTWVASDGLLDNHLRIAARAEGRALHVINLAADTAPARLQELRTWVDADPRFDTFRLEMENAVALGAATFVDAWLREDPAAGRVLLVVGMPEAWRHSGWQPVPEGYGFGGVHGLEQLNPVDLLARNRADWNRLAEILAPATNLPPPLARTRRTLCRQASRAANEFGVLCEDLGRTNEAGEAYLAANRLDRNNVCALLNLLHLPAIHAQADMRKKLEQDVRTLTDALRPRPSILSLVLMYGEVRQPEILAECGRAWARMGQSAIALSQLDRARTLAPAGSNARQLLGNTLAAHGDTAAAARTYRAMADSDTNNTMAMIGFASMCLNDGRTTEARQWLDRARKSGAEEPVWAVPHASLLLAEGQTNQALSYLRAFTGSNSGHMEAWALEADILLHQHALAEVEQQVLPAMRQAVPHSDHFLIHLVRAHLLASQAPVDYHAMRSELLRALSLRPDLADVRDDLLHADMQSGNRSELQQDVGETLRFNPDHALANYLAGARLIDQGELKRAEEHLRRSLAAHPTAAAFNDLAETLRRLGRLPEAEKAAREAIARNPRGGEAWDTLGCILLDAHHVDEAGRAIEQALALLDQDPRIHLSLARVRLAQGRPADCRQILSHPGIDPDKLPADLRREVDDLQRRAAPAKPAAPGA